MGIKFLMGEETSVTLLVVAALWLKQQTKRQTNMQTNRQTNRWTSLSRKDPIF